MTKMPDEFEISEDMVLGAFSSITNQLLISKDDKTTYDSIYRELTTLMVNDDSLKSKIDLIYNYETSRHYSLKGDYESSIPYGILALMAEPENIQTQAMVTELLRGQFLDQYKRDEVDLNIVQDLNQIRDSVPELWENTRFRQLYLDLSAAVIGVYVEQGELSGCLKMLEELEKLADENELKPEQQITSYICSGVAKYYFRKGNYTNARKAAKLGLKYYPNDGMLQTINRQLR
jgi:tetratricopeptide (TPR) repeat protein